MYTQEEIKAAKTVRDQIIQEGLDDLKSVYMAGEIVAHSELKPKPVMPTAECIETWWAQGQDTNNPGFWKEAPYRTNGDVVEEIKAALKYFITKWQ